MVSSLKQGSLVQYCIKCPVQRQGGHRHSKDELYRLSLFNRGFMSKASTNTIFHRQPPWLVIDFIVVG